MKEKINLQSHRLDSFFKTLFVIEKNLQKDRQFLSEYHDVYKFPKMIMRKNLKQIDEQLKAITVLKQIHEANRIGITTKKEIQPEPGTAARTGTT